MRHPENELHKTSMVPDRTRRSEGATMSKTKSSAAAVAVTPPPESVPPADFGGDEFEAESRAVPTGPNPELELLEEDFELDAAAAEPATSELEPASTTPKPPTDKEIEEGGGDSMLARYFREMATHPVMGPDEELRTAVEVEQAEVDHWVAILAYLPAAEFALDSLEKDLPTGEEALTLPQLGELRKLLRTFKKRRGKLSRDQEKKYKLHSTSLARAIRLADSDRLWVAHAEEVVRKLGEEPDADEQDAQLDLKDESAAPAQVVPQIPSTPQ